MLPARLHPLSNSWLQEPETHLVMEPCSAPDHGVMNRAVRSAEDMLIHCHLGPVQVRQIMPVPTVFPSAVSKTEPGSDRNMIFTPHNQPFLFALCCILAVSFHQEVSFCQSSAIELSIPEVAGQKIILEGYDGFLTVSLAEIILDSAGNGKAKINYRGFLQIRLPGGQQYPLIVKNRKTIFKLMDIDSFPVFRGDPENRFLYEYIRREMQGVRKSALLEEAFQAFNENDPFLEELLKEKTLLEAEKQELTKELSDSSKYLATLVLQAKLLLETSYSIKSHDELKERKEDFLRFVVSHYEILRYSDLVQQLAAQYMMMNEYVLWGRGFPFEKVIIADVETWIDRLEQLVPPQKIVNYFLRFYLGRSMVTLSGDITFHYREYLSCPATKTSKAKTGKIDVTIEIRRSSHSEPGLSLGKMTGSPKILFFYREGCPACIVDQVILNRKLAEHHPEIPYITVFSEGESAPGLSVLTKLQAEQFYYAVSGPLFLQAGIEQYPCLLVLSSDNKIVRKCYSPEEIQEYVGIHD